MSSDPTQRFSSRVEAYVKYRPRYPRELIGVLKEEIGLEPDWTIADLGSGTGFLSEVLLENGNQVYGVEPNQPMREAGEAYLAGREGFVSIDASAEATGLEPASVDLITAGQAFHWFDTQAARIEWLRILKPGGWVALIWNERRVEDDVVQAGYEDVLVKYGTDYDSVRFQHAVDEGQLNEFFGGPIWQLREIPYEQACDLEGLKGRVRSTSYSPEPDQPGYEGMMSALDQLFAEHEENGQIILRYRTKIYFGQITAS